MIFPSLQSKSNTYQPTQCKRPKHPPGTGLPYPLEGREGGNSMSPLVLLQRTKNMFPHWHAGAAAAATHQITDQIRHELLPGQGGHYTGRLAKGKQWYIQLHYHQQAYTFLKQSVTDRSIAEPTLLLLLRICACLPGRRYLLIP